MMNVKHFFYISSNFHLAISLEIMNLNRIDKKDVILVNNRGTTIPQEWKNNVLQISGKEFFFFRDKLIAALKSDNLNSLLNNNTIITYLPFFKQIPVNFFNNIVFFEEGFSSYCEKYKLSFIFIFKQYLKSILKYLIVNILLINKSQNIKKFVHGPLYFYTKFKSKKHFNYYTLSSGVCVGKFINSNVIVLKILKNIVDSNIEYASFVVVLDRLTSPMPYSLNNYYKYLSCVIEEYGNKKLLLKFHPADYSNDDIKNKVILFFQNNNVFVNVINESLENLALENKKITFIGTNSTILFYAPILGNNLSFSYVKYLSSIDENYFKFLFNWGGIDRFTNSFKKYVEIVDL